METDFDPAVMQDIHKWIVNYGNNMIFIYGEYDPWSASAVQLQGRTNALKMVLPGGSHRTRIRSFPQEEQEKIYKALEEWLQVKIDRGS